MIADLYEWAKIGIAALVVSGFILSRAAVRYPHVPWLRAFDFRSNADPARRAKLDRAANIGTGAEMILAGLVIPVGYVMLTLMTWGNFETLITVAVLGGSALLIAGGVVILVRAARKRD